MQEAEKSLKDKSTDMITIESKRFNTLEVSTERLVTIPHGIIGFSDIKQYVMLDPIPNTPFIWFHAVSNPYICFIVVDPYIVKPDYSIDFDKDLITELKNFDPKNLIAMVIATVPAAISEMSVNLKGPIVINLENKLAKQIVLTDKDYPTRYDLFK